MTSINHFCTYFEISGENGEVARYFTNHQFGNRLAIFDFCLSKNIPIQSLNQITAYKMASREDMPVADTMELS